MYIEPEISITKGTDNTFIIQYKVKRKKNKGKNEAEVYPRYDEKIITASDVEELKTKLGKLLNSMPKADTEEDEFEEAFNE